MTTFYFTATGNSLAVAKAIGGNLISIPLAIHETNFHIKDDVVGVVFPIYGFAMPKMVREFLTKVTWEADYTFAIGTYGNKTGAAMMDLQTFGQSIGKPFDYAASLIMVDNYLPGFDMKSQKASLPDKRVAFHLDKIKRDIESRKRVEVSVNTPWRLATKAVRDLEGLIMNEKQAQKYIVNAKCTQCGICEKVCPTGNVKVTTEVVFSTHCAACFACLHNCPQNALHMKHQKSEVRWRNPEVSVAEIIRANHQIMGSNHE